MALFEQFPYNNFHELNLDFILKKIKELEEKLVALTKRVTKNEEDIANHEKRITANEKELANHEKRITANEKELADHEDRISTLEPIVANNVNRLDRLDPLVDDIRDSIDLYQFHNGYAPIAPSKVYGEEITTPTYIKVYPNVMSPEIVTFNHITIPEDWDKTYFAITGIYFKNFNVDLPANYAEKLELIPNGSGWQNATTEYPNGYFRQLVKIPASYYGLTDIPSDIFVRSGYIGLTYQYKTEDEVKVADCSMPVQFIFNYNNEYNEIFNDDTYVPDDNTNVNM